MSENISSGADGIRISQEKPKIHDLVVADLKDKYEENKQNGRALDKTSEEIDSAHRHLRHGIQKVRNIYSNLKETGVLKENGIESFEEFKDKYKDTQEVSDYLKNKTELSDQAHKDGGLIDKARMVKEKVSKDLGVEDNMSWGELSKKTYDRSWELSEKILETRKQSDEGKQVIRFLDIKYAKEQERNYGSKYLIQQLLDNKLQNPDGVIKKYEGVKLIPDEMGQMFKIDDDYEDIAIDFYNKKLEEQARGSDLNFNERDLDGVKRSLAAKVEHDSKAIFMHELHYGKFEKDVKEAIKYQEDSEIQKRIMDGKIKDTREIIESLNLQDALSISIKKDDEVEVWDHERAPGFRIHYSCPKYDVQIDAYNQEMGKIETQQADLKEVKNNLIEHPPEGINKLFGSEKKYKSELEKVEKMEGQLEFNYKKNRSSRDYLQHQVNEQIYCRLNPEIPLYMKQCGIDVEAENIKFDDFVKLVEEKNNNRVMPEDKKKILDSYYSVQKRWYQIKK